MSAKVLVALLKGLSSSVRIPGTKTQQMGQIFGDSTTVLQPYNSTIVLPYVCSGSPYYTQIAEKFKIIVSTLRNDFYNQSDWRIIRKIVPKFWAERRESKESVLELKLVL